MNNELNIIDENGNAITINVLDILDENSFNKEFVIYTLEGDDDTVYASILNEQENSYSLDTLTSDEEMNYVNEYIDSIANEKE